MDLEALAKDLGLKDTDKYRYLIREHISSDGHKWGYEVQRYNKELGYVCSITLSNQLLAELTREGRQLFKEGVVDEWKKQFDLAEQRAINKDEIVDIDSTLL